MVALPPAVYLVPLPPEDRPRLSRPPASSEAAHARLEDEADRGRHNIQHPSRRLPLRGVGFQGPALLCFGCIRRIAPGGGQILLRLKRILLGSFP